MIEVPNGMQFAPLAVCCQKQRGILLKVPNGWRKGFAQQQVARDWASIRKDFCAGVAAKEAMTQWVTGMYAPNGSYSGTRI